LKSKKKPPELDPDLKEFIDTYLVPMLKTIGIPRLPTATTNGRKNAREMREFESDKTLPQPTALNASPYLTIAEAAKYLKTTPWFIAQEIRKGELPFARMGKRFVLKPSDLDEFFSRIRE
jgi:excisionase family DNA binding protein